jgi:hypothetical protein
MKGQNMIQQINNLSNNFNEDLVCYLFIEKKTRKKILLGCKLAKHFRTDELDCGDYIG